MPEFKIPSGYRSKDVIDRRNGEKPTLSDRARDVTIAVRDDWNDMRANENRRAGRSNAPDFSGFRKKARSKGRSSGR